ncbi:hypothetical protein [Metabacillus fastidiosus]|uniref:hypothetical protein n=1 Tax=Metabacillus fastidiosus TaxID=1458 RepID=UPI003D2D8943
MQEPYIALENFNLTWELDEVKEFEVYWHRGLSIFTLANYFKRTTDEVFLLVMDLAMKDYIKARSNGIYTSQAEKISTNLAITRLKNHYERYDVLLGYSFFWRTEDIMTFQILWKSNWSVTNIAKSLKRKLIEVAILVVDQASKGKIQPREESLFGKGGAMDAIIRKSAS